MPAYSVEIDDLVLSSDLMVRLQTEALVGRRLSLVVNIKVDDVDNVMDMTLPTAFPAVPPSGLVGHAGVDITDAARVEVRIRLALTDPHEVIGHTLVTALRFPFPTQWHLESSIPHADLFFVRWKGVNSDRPSYTLRTGGRPGEEGAVARGCINSIRARSNLWSYRPCDPTSLVVESREFDPPVADFVNWQDTSAVFHMKRATNRWKTPADITGLVIHETAGFVLNNPATAPRAWKKTAKGNPTSISAHFCVHSDGSIAQHYDACQWLAHAGRRNGHTVGIEVVNLAFEPLAATAAGGIGTYRISGDEIETDTIRGWHFGRNRNEAKRYIVPPLQQLEALHDLVDALVFHLGIEENYLSLFHQTGRAAPVLYHGAYSGHDAANRWLMWHYKALFDRARNHSGIYSHFNIGGRGTHVDGSFPALYLWLRRQKGFPPAAARQTAMDLVRTPWNAKGTPWRWSHGMQWLDISAVAWPPPPAPAASEAGQTPADGPDLADMLGFDDLMQNALGPVHAESSPPGAPLPSTDTSHTPDTVTADGDQPSLDEVLGFDQLIDEVLDPDDG